MNLFFTSIIIRLACLVLCLPAKHELNIERASKKDPQTSHVRHSGSAPPQEHKALPPNKPPDHKASQSQPPEVKRCTAPNPLSTGLLGMAGLKRTLASHGPRSGGTWMFPLCNCMPTQESSGARLKWNDISARMRKGNRSQAPEPYQFHLKSSTRGIVQIGTLQVAGGARIGYRVSLRGRRNLLPGLEVQGLHQHHCIETPIRRDLSARPDRHMLGAPASDRLQAGRQALFKHVETLRHLLLDVPPLKTPQRWAECCGTLFAQTTWAATLAMLAMPGASELPAHQYAAHLGPRIPTALTSLQ